MIHCDFQRTVVILHLHPISVYQRIDPSWESFPVPSESDRKHLPLKAWCHVTAAQFGGRCPVYILQDVNLG